MYTIDTAQTNLSGIARIRTLIERSAELSFVSLNDRLTPNYWLALTIAHVVAWMFEGAYADADFNSLSLRLLICATTLPLFLSKIQTFKGIRKHNRIYFILTMWLHLPFLFSMLSTLNLSQLTEPTISNNIWFYQYFVALMLFFGLLSSINLSLFLVITAQILTAALVFLISDSNKIISFGVSSGMLATSLTVYCFSYLTHEKLAFVDQQKIETAYGIGARVAHELRTPLLSISNFSRAALKRLGNEASSSDDISASVEYLKQIVEEVTYSNRTIDLLLVTTSKAPFDNFGSEPIEARTLIVDTLNTFPYSNSNEIKQVAYATSEDNFEIIGSKRLVKHVLFNLVKNALLETKIHNEKRIFLGHYRVREKGFIYVSDNGPGIPKENRSKIFDNFFTTRTGGDGTGIGLAFCKSVMNDLGGSISYSREGDLSVFLLTFPLTKKSALAPPHSSPH